MRKPELLMPAGDLETLAAALRYGADAVYIGGERFSLRARAGMSLAEVTEAVATAHKMGGRVYIAVNVFAREADLSGIRDFLTELGDVGPDALIISDPGIVMLARELCPDIDIHISTQINSTNELDYIFWSKIGARRVVAARELTLSEIALIREALVSQAPETEIECFVHGAMCISYSGRCLLSSYMTGRSANAGACTHPCRWRYHLMEETRPGEYFPIEEDERGTYIMNSRDLCMIEHIPELIAVGVDSLKVEGRMKSLSYVALTAMAYREAIDDFFVSRELYLERLPHYLELISKSTHREFSTGFYFGDPGAEGQIYSESAYSREYIYLGSVSEVSGGDIIIRQKNKFAQGDRVEIVSPGADIVSAQVLMIRDPDTLLSMPSCPHAGQMLIVSLDAPARPGDILIKESDG